MGNKKWRLKCSKDIGAKWKESLALSGQSWNNLGIAI